MRMRPYHRRKYPVAQVVIPAEAWLLAQKPYTIAVTNDDVSGYIAEVAELPGLMVAADTEEALRRSLEKMIALYITTLMHDGLPVPQPMSLTVH